MTQQAIAESAPTTINGVDVSELFQTIGHIKAAPDLAQFRFRALGLFAERLFHLRIPEQVVIGDPGGKLLLRSVGGAVGFELVPYPLPAYTDREYSQLDQG